MQKLNQQPTHPKLLTNQKLKLAIAIIAMLVGSQAIAYSTVKSAILPRQSTWATPIATQANLYQVDNLLYRSEQLKVKDIQLIQQLGIKTIINLRYFDKDEDVERLSNNGFNLINEPLMTWAVKPKQIAHILYQIQRQQQQGNKVLVHCYHGADRTGITIAMYRIIRQGWSVEQAKTEMLYGGYGFHPIWNNLEKMLTEQKVNEVKTELAKLEKANVNG